MLPCLRMKFWVKYVSVKDNNVFIYVSAKITTTFFIKQCALPMLPKKTTIPLNKNGRHEAG